MLAPVLGAGEGRERGGVSSGVGGWRGEGEGVC